MTTSRYSPDRWARLLLSQAIDPAEFRARTAGLYAVCCQMDRRLDELLSQRLKREGARRLAELRRSERPFPALRSDPSVPDRSAAARRAA